MLRFNYFSEEVNCRTLGVSTYRSLSDSTVVAEIEISAFLCWLDFCDFIRKNSEIIVLS
nr:MAG TPA: hypothetical protein [Bacteriophage sp.]